MNYRLVLNHLGMIMLCYPIVFILPLLAALYFKEDVFAFIYPALASLILGAALLFISEPAGEVMGYKEGEVIVGVGWIFVALLGSLPYIYYGISPVDAFFETMSGLTTTGATIIDRVEGLPLSLLLWRSLTQWLGGIGIIVIFVAFLPALSKRGSALFRAEFPSIKLEKIKPRVRDTALRLFLTYLILTAAGISLLALLGMPLFDAVNHTFASLSTGGFSTHTESIAYFNDPKVELGIILLMAIGGAPLPLIYSLLIEKRALRDTEFLSYISILLIASTVLTALNLHRYGIIESIRYSFFQAVSLMTTTGFTTCDFDSWCDSAKILLLALMFIGGCTRSTAGGIKVARIYLLIQYSISRILKRAEPEALRVIRFNGEIVGEEVLHDITAFFSIYVLVAAASAFLISLFGLDFLTSISAVAATLNNVGPAMGTLGASETFSSLPPIAKLILSIDMWMGRLELFTVLSLFIPSFWRGK